MPTSTLDIKTDMHGSPGKVDDLDKSLEGMGKQAEKSGKSFEAMGKKMSKVGKKMTIAGAAILGGLGLIVKGASDAEETASKFGIVFADAIDEASKAAENLAENYLLSEEAAKSMLAQTGDLLTGMGFTDKAALSLSEKTQQLAADLASFGNFAGGAVGASNALTKAMLGEAEMAKSLGINIKEAFIKTELLRVGKDKLRGMALLQAKAEAVLTISMRQSKKAIGDVAKTSHQLANKSRELKARLDDTVNTIGKALIPLVTKLVTKATEILKKVTKWTKENPKLTKTIAKSALALGVLLSTLGPLLIILPKLVAGIKLVKKAFKAGNITTMAAIAVFAFTITKVLKLISVMKGLKKARKEARESQERATEAVGKFDVKLEKIIERAGLTSAEFETLKEKYEGNTLALGHAILKGKEGVELQEAMRDVGQENVDKFEAQKEAVEGFSGALETDLQPAMQGVSDLHKTLVDEIKKATLDEHDFRVAQAIDVYEQRKTQLENENASKEDFILLEEAHGLELKDINADRLKDNQEKADEIKGKWADHFEELIKKENEFKDFKKSVKDKIDQFTLDEFGLKEKESKEAYDAMLKNLEDNFADTAEYAELKLNIERGYSLDRAAIEDARAAKQAATESAELEASRRLMEEKLKHWLSMADEMGGVFADFAVNILDKNTTMKEKLQGLWTGIKDSFKNMIGGMIKEFATNFVKNIIMGAVTSGKAMEKVAGTFKSTGKTIGGIGEGIGKLIESLGKGIGKALEALATSIANAARSLAAAAPQILIVGAVALALFAGFSAIKALFSGGGGKTAKTGNALLQEIRNKTFDIFNGAQWMWKMITGEQQGRFDNMIKKADWNLAATEGILGYQEAIKDNTDAIAGYTRKMLAELVSIPKSAKGGFFDKPTLTWVGEKGPEYIIPASKVSRGTGGTVQVNINVNSPLISTTGNVSQVNIKQAARALMKEIEKLSQQGRFTQDVQTIVRAET